MINKITGLRVKIAATRRANPGRALKIIAVAGPYGKTTSIRFLEAILRESGKKISTLSNESGDQSYDASLDSFFKHLARAKRKRSDYVIVEVSSRLEASGALRQTVLNSLILTGESESTARLLSLQPKHVVAPSDLEILKESVEPYQHISFGEDELAEAKIDAITLYKNGTELAMTIDHQTKIELATYLVGKANAKSLAVAVAAAYVLGTDLTAVQEGIADIQPFYGRFERITDSDPLTICDVGTNDQSIKLALESAKELTKRRLIVAMDAGVSPVSIKLIKTKADRLFMLGAAESVDSATAETVATKEAAIEKVNRAAKTGDTILCIGPKFLERGLHNLPAEDIQADKTSE